MTDHTRTEKISSDSIYFCGHPSRAKNRCDNMKVKPIDKLIYHVKDVHKDCVVNIQHKTCTCRKFELDLFPCAHAVVVIRSYYYCHT